MDFIPYKAHECFDYLYYPIPMELFFNKKYKGKIKSAGKLLYGFLLNRLSLSAKNNWVDENGDIFLIFTRKEVQEMLDLSDKTSLSLYSISSGATSFSEVESEVFFWLLKVVPI